MVVLKMKAFLFLFLILFCAGKAWGCKCQEMSVEESFQVADLVVQGTVLSIERVSVSSTLNEGKITVHPPQLNVGSGSDTFLLEHPIVNKIRIRVQRVFKRDTKEKIITIYTPVAGASCGIDYFEAGVSFIVYTKSKSFFLEFFIRNYKEYKMLERPGTYWTNRCAGTSFFTEAEAKILQQLH